MHEGTVANGPIGNWLAIIGVISLIYWGWHICAAFLGPRPRKEECGSCPCRGGGGRLCSPRGCSGAEDDIVVIAAAVYAQLGAHRIVRIEEESQAQTWAVEGRWMQQTSHTTRP